MFDVSNRLADLAKEECGGDFGGAMSFVDVVAPSKPELDPKIKQSESYLASIPDTQWNAHIRQAVIADIEATKKLISESKPRGSQLDGAKQALQRALGRQQRAVNLPP